MKVKFSDILEANEALGKITKERLPVREALSLARLIKRLNEEMTFFNEQRERLLVQYGKEQESGEFIVEKENLPEFIKDYEELLKSEVETWSEKIKITLQKDSTIEAAVIVGCEKFCEFEEAE